MSMRERSFRRPDPQKRERPSTIIHQYLEDILEAVESLLTSVETVQSRLDRIEQELEAMRPA